MTLARAVQIVYTGMDRSSELAAIIGSGDAVLFTGAGFSADAKDCSGRNVPDSAEMVCELWSMLFGDAPHDGSSLADLYDVALLEKPDELPHSLGRGEGGRSCRQAAALGPGPFRASA